MNISVRMRDALVVLAIGLFAIFLFLNIESYEFENYTGEGKQARQNSFLALQTHLASYNTQTVVSQNVNSLFSESRFGAIYPELNDVIILTQAQLNISEVLADNILEWVGQGGSVVIGLSSNIEYELNEALPGESSSSSAIFFNGNYLLQKLGISTAAFNPNVDNDNAQKKHKFNVPTLIETSDFGTLEVNVEDSISINVEALSTVIYSAAVLPGKYLEDHVEAHVEDHLKNHVENPTIVQIQKGNGVITVMTDVQVWENDQIDMHDNVFFLHELVKGSPTLYIFSQREIKMWPSLIAQYSPSFYWILLFVVVLSIWFSAVRFGTITLVNDTVMSYFSQHIRAAGQFYWTNNQKEKLLGHVRQALLEEMSSKLIQTHPSEAQFVDGLVAISHWPRDKVIMYVFGKNKVNETQFTQIMQGLQQLREIVWKN